MKQPQRILVIGLAQMTSNIILYYIHERYGIQLRGKQNDITQFDIAQPC